MSFPEEVKEGQNRTLFKSDWLWEWGREKNKQKGQDRDRKSEKESFSV